ncbi:MAG: molybdenum cofactor guanylyltransferase, partial [Microcystaceae cyanobacterium]
MNQPSIDSITAIVLAGGQSSRMGQDKALLTIGNQPLLRQICLLAQECTSQVYVVTPWPERYHSILPDDCRVIQEILSPGATQPHGPLIGFAQGLTQIQTDWVLLLACDLPNLTVSEVKKWSTSLAEVSAEAIALLPRNPKGWEPLCGFYRRRCHLLLDQFIHRGGRSFQAWLAQHPVQELPVSNFQC